jgi:hypothetical protein
LAEEPPDAAQLASFGFTPADFQATDAVTYWPEHAAPVRVFMSMQTQWRVSFSGLVGLDYNALASVYQGLQIEDESIPEVFSQLQVIELKFLEIKRQTSK